MHQKTGTQGLLSPQPAHAAAPIAVERPRKRLLLIEDDPATRLLLLNRLRATGLDVDVAANGHIALDKLRTRCPDAIFMDLLLPDVKGVDIIKAAREHSEFANRPIYVCTSASLMDTWSRRGIEAGATKVIDRATTPIEKIVAEVSADLLPPEPKTAPAAPSTSIAPSSADDPSTASEPLVTASAINLNEGPAKTNTIVKRFLTSFGFNRTNAASNPAKPESNSASAVASKSKTSPTPVTNPASVESIATSALPPVATETPVAPPNLGASVSPAKPVAASVENWHPPINPLARSSGVAVLTLDDIGAILSADDACPTIFGWKALELVGQNVMTVLKDGLNNDLGRFLQQLKTAERGKESRPFAVTVRRRDGSEFSASVTPLLWSSETTASYKCDSPRFTWTAVFRDARVVAETAAAPHAVPTRTMPPSLPLPAATIANPVPASETVSPASTIPAGVVAATQALEHRLVEANAEAEQQRATLATTRHERDALSERIRSGEEELQRLRTELENANVERRRIEDAVAQLTMDKADMEKALLAQNLSREELTRTTTLTREELDAVRQVAEKAEAAQKQEAARAAQLESDLTQLRQEREELDTRLAAEHEAATTLRQRAAELEERLRESDRRHESPTAEASPQNSEQAGLEEELRHQLEVARATAGRAEAALKDEANRNKGFEERLRLLCDRLKLEQGERAERFDREVNRLWQAHDDLQDRLTSEQKLVAGSTLRALELEKELRERGDEVDRVKSALEKQTAEQSRLEAEWRDRLGTTEALTRKLENALADAEEQNKRSEEELIGLRREREELTARLAAEQRTAADSRQRVQDLEQRLSENAAELERVNSELVKTGRGKGLETELASLYQMRDMLNCKLASEQRANEESRSRGAELERRLRENNAELDRVKAEADQQAAERARVESQLLTQLSATKAAADHAEAALKETTGRCASFELELLELRRNRDDLNGRLEAEQHAVAESRRRNEDLESQLRQNKTELDRVKAAAEKNTAERTQLEADWRSQLEAAQAATARAEAALAEESDRSRGFDERLRIFGNELRLEQNEATHRLELELAEASQARRQFQDQLAAEQAATAEARRATLALETRVLEGASELERLRSEAARAEDQHRDALAGCREQMRIAKAAAAQADTTAREEAQRSLRMEQELITLRKGAEDLKTQVADSQHGVAKARRRVKELEKQLRASATGFARFKVELDKRAAELNRRDAELETVRAAARQAEAISEESTTRARQLAEELDGLRQVHDELSARFTSAQQAGEDSHRRIQELEARVQEGAAELARVQTTLEHQMNQPPAPAQTPTPESPAPTAPPPAALAEEMSRLRENEAAHLAEMSEVERRVRESVSALARVTAELEKERGDRRRAEQRSASLAAQLQQLHEELKQHLESARATQFKIGDLEHQLRERDERLVHLHADWQKEAADRQLAAEQLRSFGDMNAQLRKYLALFEESKNAFKRSQEELETRLQTVRTAHDDAEARLQKETMERQRLEDSLASAQRNVQDQTERNALELARLQSELQLEQFERKRLEGDAVQSRYVTLDSTRIGRAMVNSFRRQVRQPVEELLQSTRRLLEAELKEEEKQLVESVLESALFVEANLQESGTLAGGRCNEHVPEEGLNPLIQPEEEMARRGETPASESAPGLLQP